MIRFSYFLFSGTCRYVFLLSVIFLAGCEYHTDKVNYQDVKKPDNASMVINLNPSESKYIITDYKWFNYNSFTDKGKIYNISVFVDTTKISDINDSIGSFKLDAGDYMDGNHTLTIIATTSSGSGSLADLLGAEGFVFSFSWDLMINYIKPEYVNLTRIFNDSGILKIEWEKYKRENFDRYEVIKTTWDNVNPPHSITVAIVKDRNQSYIYDSTFTGGHAAYYIKVFTRLSNYSTSGYLGFYEPYWPMQATWIQEDLVKLSWDKCNYPKVFKQYRIFRNNQLIYTSDNLDSNFIIKPVGVIGENSKYRLDILGGGDENSVQNVCETQQYIGYKMMPHKDFYSNTGDESAYITTHEKSYYWHKLYRFNTNTRTCIDSVDFPEYNSVFVVSQNNGAVICTSQAISFNPSRLSDYHSISQKCQSLGCLSDDSKGLVYANSSWVLYDFKNLQTVTTFPGTYWTYTNFISGDNLYNLSINTTRASIICHKLTNGQLTFMWEIPKAEFMFIPGEPDKFMILNNSACEIRKIETNQVLNSFPADGVSFLGIDQSTKTVMIKKATASNKILLLNYQTGVALKEFEVAPEVGIRYVRGSVYATSGFEIPIRFKK